MIIFGLVILCILLIVYFYPEYLVLGLGAIGLTLYTSNVDTKPTLGRGDTYTDTSTDTDDDGVYYKCPESSDQPFGNRCELSENPSDCDDLCMCEAFCKYGKELDPTPEGVLALVKQGYNFPIPTDLLEKLVNKDPIMVKKYRQYRINRSMHQALMYVKWNLPFKQKIAQQFGCEIFGDFDHQLVTTPSKFTKYFPENKIAGGSEQYKDIYSYYQKIFQKYNRLLLCPDILKDDKITALHNLYFGTKTRLCFFGLPEHDNAIFIDVDHKIITRLEPHYGRDLFPELADDIQHLFIHLSDQGYVYRSTTANLYGKYLQGNDTSKIHKITAGRCTAWTFFMGLVMMLNYKTEPMFGCALAGILGYGKNDYKILNLFLFYVYQVPVNLDNVDACADDLDYELGRLADNILLVKQVSTSNDDQQIKQQIVLELLNNLSINGQYYYDEFTIDKTITDPSSQYYSCGLARIYSLCKKKYIPYITDDNVQPKHLYNIICAAIKDLFNLDTLQDIFDAQILTSKTKIKKETGRCVIL